MPAQGCRITQRAPNSSLPLPLVSRPCHPGTSTLSKEGQGYCVGTHNLPKLAAPSHLSYHASNSDSFDQSQVLLLCLSLGRRTLQSLLLLLKRSFGTQPAISCRATVKTLSETTGKKHRNEDISHRTSQRLNFNRRWDFLVCFVVFVFIS